MIEKEEEKSGIPVGIAFLLYSKAFTIEIPYITRCTKSQGEINTYFQDIYGNIFLKIQQLNDILLYALGIKANKFFYLQIAKPFLVQKRRALETGVCL